MAASISSAFASSSSSSVPSFSSYTESGPALLSGGGRLRGTFVLSGASSTLANTLRRTILTSVRSVGFDVESIIRKNTSVIFNEMLSHRISMIPLAGIDLATFNPEEYQCVLRVKNSTKDQIRDESLLHVTASDFRVFRKDAESGEFQDMGEPAAKAMFPPDPISGQTILIVTLRPQWNPDQPPEEIDLTATPVIRRGGDDMVYCPVSQCSFENTPDKDPVRQDKFFTEWLREFKKIGDTEKSTLSPEALRAFKTEWGILGAQRCFLVNGKGEPDTFGFTVESVGVRSVPDIVAEGIQEVIELVRPFTTGLLAEQGVTIRPANSRMINGVDLVFNNQGHTLGVLLQDIITELYFPSADGPLQSVGYKVPHPLQKVMEIRMGFREGVVGTETLIQEILAKAAMRAIQIFEGMGRSWTTATAS